MKFVLIVILVAAVAGLVYWRKRTSGETKAPSPHDDPKPWLAPQKLTITTASESDKRAAHLLPATGSEDVSSLLVRPKLPSLPPEGEPNHGPREAVRLPVQAARARSRELDALQRDLEEAHAVVVLAAPAGKSFDGTVVWDVMMCLGLRWGDMDRFHWENHDPSLGDDHLFSISTSTEPGYFLPEEIAAGRLHVRNLVFEFSIPRSADPKVVLEALLAAATYAQRRLGGALVDSESAELEPDALRKHVAEVTARLTRAGFPPGHDATMALF